jgi:hypothetical protein
MGKHRDRFEITEQVASDRTFVDQSLFRNYFDNCPFAFALALKNFPRATRMISV